MKLLKYINIPVFLISFALGIFAVYVMSPDKKKIIVYPTPDSVSHVQYKDQAGNCFQYKQTKVQCPKDGFISKTPVQGDSVTTIDDAQKGKQSNTLGNFF